MDDISLGVIAVTAGGILNGSFTFPMKLVTKWQWENIWLLFGVFGLVLMPVGYALASVPHLLQVYRLVPPGTLAIAVVLGAAWGTGSLFFGLAVSALGISLGYAITMGATAVFGTLIPAAILQPGLLATSRGIRLLASLVAILLGLVLCAIAGRRRETLDMQSGGPQYRILTRTAFRRGLLISLLAGVFSACFNIGFALMDQISESAIRLGSDPGNAAFSIWALIMAAGFLPNLGYCLWLFRQNGSASFFRETPRNWIYAVAMGLLWIAGVKFYGSGVIKIGAAGALIGWPILMALTIITANFLGFLTGEWKKTTWLTQVYVYAGLSVLIGAVILAGSAGPQN
jgi:L-rhamnose-H+ transport protein